jgi:leucyl aminopeptidase
MSDIKIIKDNSAFSESVNRVFVGSSDSIPNWLSEEQAKDFNSFLDKEEDYLHLKSLNSSVFFIKENDDLEKMRKHGAKVRADLDRKSKGISISATDGSYFPLLEGFVLSSYKFSKYLAKKEEKEFLLDQVIVGDNCAQSVIDEVQNIKSAVSWARDMVNEPVSYLNAETLAEEISGFAGNTGLNITVLEKTQIESLKMGGLLAVNQGSVDPPTFTIVEHKPDKAVNKKPIVLVGKGVVYDTGGLSLKPTPNSMDVMKSDMGGAACMAGAIYLTALQNLPVHVIALIPATDNRPGLNAYAPGDIVKMYNGSTVEVRNTDAEGRMIMADALAYSSKYDPELVIDAATLTGSAYRAIGHHACVIMGNAEGAIIDNIEKAGKEMHERVVKLPFWDDYFEEMKSDIADLNNLGGPTAGMITAGKFLEHFVEAPYIHMDIAGPAWLDKQDGYRTKGGSGYGVRLLYQFFKNLSNGES